MRSPARRLWLLEVDLGRVYRFATEALEVDREDGTVLHFEPGLDDPVLSVADGDAGGDAEARVSVAAGVDWAALVASGIPIEGRRATLRRWEEGTVYERARVAIAGDCYGTSYGSTAEALEVTIVRSASYRSDVVPPAQAAIDAKTWPITGGYAVPERSAGLAYPVILGAPGHAESGSPSAAVPVGYAQTGAAAAFSYIAIADGYIDATTVRLYDLDASPPTSSDRAVSVVNDLLGRPVSVVTNAAIVDSAQWYIGLAATSSYGLGLSHRGSPVRGAWSLLRWALQEHTDLRVDWARFDAQREALDAYAIDTYIASATNVWEWVQDAILPLLPVELRESDRGLYPAVWRWGATPRDAVLRLDATSGSGQVVRTSPVSAVADIANEITVLYRPAADQGVRWLSRRIATGRGGALAKGFAGASVAADSRVIGFGTLVDSQATYGVRSLTIEASHVWDHRTADLILRDQVRARGWARRTVTYEGPPELESLLVGNVVLLTDPELSLTDRPALVWDIVPGAAPEVVLVLVDHPRQDLRAV